RDGDSESRGHRMALARREAHVLRGDDVQAGGVLGCPRGHRQPLTVRQSLKVNLDQCPLSFAYSASGVMARSTMISAEIASSAAWTRSKLISDGTLARALARKSGSPDQGLFCVALVKSSMFAPSELRTALISRTIPGRSWPTTSIDKEYPAD